MFDLNNRILCLPLEEGKEEIEKIISLGYTDVILTYPVLLDGEYLQDEALKKFSFYKTTYSQINLYYGNEINYHYTLIMRLRKGEIKTLNDTNYLFLNLPKEEKPDQLRQLILALYDYRIILSCSDEYKYLSIKDLMDLKKNGILMFVNLNNIDKHKTKKMLKEKMVDFIGTYENVNKNCLGKCEKRIEKEYFTEITKNNYTKFLK